jgi:ABC-type iron transport system FetAB permease component
MTAHLTHTARLAHTPAPNRRRRHWRARTAAAREATCRVKYTYRGLYTRVWLSVALPAIGVLMFALLYIVPVHPWYTPQYFITMGGMAVSLTALRH